MNRRFYLPPVRGIAAARRRVIGTMNLHYVPLIVLYDARAGDEIAITQSHFASRREAEVLLRRIFPKILLLDIQHAREGHAARSSGGILRVIHRLHLLRLALR